MIDPAAAARLEVLGPVRLVADGADVAFRAERRFQLLVLLALQGGQWLERDRVAALLWPDHALPDARRNLRKVLFRARELPGTRGLEASDAALRWPVPVDLDALAGADADTLLALWRGAPLGGVDDNGNAAWSDWLRQAASRAAALWQQAAHARLGQLAGVPLQALAHRLLEIDALDEAAAQALVRAQLASGQGIEARRTVREFSSRVADELGIEPSRALGDLLAGSAAAGSAGQAFVGRRLEVQQIEQQLASDARALVTLSGTGGVGKTRLAREVLARVAARYAGGAHWIDAQELPDSDAVLAELARVLRVPRGDAGALLDKVLRALPDEPALVIIDGAEHLARLDALVERLRAAARPLSLLVTTRSRLKVAGESLLVLRGLPVPDEDSRDPEAAAAFDAVRLFAQRAGAARPGFDLARSLAAVIETVDAVGGLPLAIELAAGWVRLLPPEEIARDLRESIELLHRDPAAGVQIDGADSIRAALDRSWELAAPAERHALAALSVFRGGFTGAHARTVAGVALPVLASLVDKSLLQVDEGRFAAHPLVAAYARERLARQPDTAAAIGRRHAQHFSALAVELGRRAHTPQQIDALREFDAELENLRAAFMHAVLAHDSGTLAAMAMPLAQCLELRGRWVEGVTLLHQAVEQASDAAHGLPGALWCALATLQFRSAQTDAAEDSARRGHAAARAARQRDVLAGCLAAIGLSRWQRGQTPAALRCFERALAHARRSGNLLGIATHANGVCMALMPLGRFDAALARCREALAAARALGSPKAIATALNHQGGIAFVQRRYDEADRCWHEGLRLMHDAELVPLEVTFHINLGLLYTDRGQLDLAERHFREVALREPQRVEPLARIGSYLGLGRVAVQRRDAAALAHCVRQALALSHQAGAQTRRLEALVLHGESERLAGKAADAAACWLSAIDTGQLHPAQVQAVQQMIDGLSLDAATLAEAAVRARERPAEARLAELTAMP